MSYFLDYYHPHAGLCNQLYLITNHIHDAYNKGLKLFIHKFNIDIFKKNRIHADKVFDFEKTNENLKQLLGKDLIILKCPDLIEHIPKLCIYPVSSIEILNCLHFNSDIMKTVSGIQSTFPSGYYGVHFRLDIDAVLHYTFGKEIYTTFMNSSSPIEYFNGLDQTKIENYCQYLLRSYLTFISQFGFDKPWYICTSILKSSIHAPMVKYLKEFIDFISNNNGKYFISNNKYPDRELNALVDLLVLRDSEKMIGFEGSSFSEGYCYKVNSIRKVTKEYLFVKEYP